MLSSRARTRFAALVAAVPVLVAMSPAMPANAAGEYTASSLVTDGQVLGPNAGYLNLGIGQSGSTALFQINTPSTGSTISSLRVTLVKSADTPLFSLRDVDGGDGFALYGNADNSAGFSAIDKAVGAVSAGYNAESPLPSGDIPIRINLSPAATGYTTYFLAIHPSKEAANGVRLAFRLDTGEISGSGGNGPSETVTTPLKTASADPRVLIDNSVPNPFTGLSPVPADRAKFTPLPQRAGFDDFYDVASSIAQGDLSVQVAFFNNSTDGSDTAILTRQGYDKTKPPAQQVSELAVQPLISSDAVKAHVSIGDGTGLVPGATSVARNNQKSNAVYARLVDRVGNLSAPIPLSMCPPSGTSCETPARGNPVIGPAAPTSAAFTFTGESTAINTLNRTAVPVRVVSPSDADDARGQGNSDTSSKATQTRVTLVQLDAAGQRTSTIAAPKAAPYDTTDDTFDTTVNSDAVEEPIPYPGIADGAKAVAVAVNLDAYDNPSGSAVTSGTYKDVTRPTLVAISNVTQTGVPQPGDIDRIQFSEPMDKDDIDEPAFTSGTGATERCAPQETPAGETVEVQLPVTAPSNGVRRTWGSGNCFRWSVDGSSATVRLGDKDMEPDPCDNNATTPAPLVDCYKLAAPGDVVTPTGTLSAPAVSDLAGNQLVADKAPPNTVGQVPITAPVSFPLDGQGITRDDDKSGTLESVDITFSAAVNPPTTTDNLVAVGPVTIPVLSAAVQPGGKIVRFSFASGVFGTGVTPDIRLSRPAPTVNDPNPQTGMTEAGTNLEILPFNAHTADRAKPQVKSIATVDENKNGKLDKVVVTYTEPIDHTKDNNNESNIGWWVKGPTGAASGYENKICGAAIAANCNESLSTTGANDTTILTTTEKTTFDTAATPIVRHAKAAAAAIPQQFTTDTADPPNVMDPDGALTYWERLTVDKAPASIISRTTRDTDSDGVIDKIDLKFSEPISLDSTNGSFTVTGHNITGRSGLGGDGIRLAIDETAAPGTGDSNALPTVQYSGGVADTLGNPTPVDPGPVATTDGAGPAIIAACGSSPADNAGICPVEAATDDKITLLMSEPVDPASLAQADFVVEQPAGTTKTQTAAPTVSGADAFAGRLVTLTFGNGTIDANADALVRFSAIDVVTDTATPIKQKNSQTANVTVAGLPTVSLNLTCPTPANPGYCTSTTINTGATGSSGIVKWRLAETARGTAPADSEFTTSPPATLTLPEGSHTLYFSGKDSFGRFSPEISRSITIYLPPTIVSSSVKYVDLTSAPAGTWAKTGSTPVVVDGDNVRVEADGYGTDAPSWKSSTGNCLAANMSVDYRSITRNSGNGAVAPFSCDLFTNTAPAHRHMVFPIVKASGTTHYPVGTVLRTSSTDPGSMIVDGPNGTQLRRQFISVNARRSWQITDASVITVPSAVITGVTRTRNLGYRDGALVHTRGSGAYYYVLNGEKHFVSQSTLGYWRMSLSTAYTVTSGEMSLMPSKPGFGPGAHPAGTWIKFSSGSIQQIVRNGQGVLVRRQLAASQALKTLVPASQVYVANSRDAALPLDSFKRGYRDGTLLRFSDGTYGVVARGALRRFANPATFNTLGYNASNAILPNGAAISHVTGQSYLVGATIDRYLLTSLVITVRNTAGATASATVLPALGGIYGVGTLDAVPDGWDFTRS